MERALVIGGSGPTGAHIVHGLADRGFEVTLFHRGTHEDPGVQKYEHIHGDPHFRETVEAALAGRKFDVVIATYGRIRVIAEALAGRCGQFIGIGGVPIYRGWLEPDRLLPHGMAVMTREDAPRELEPGDNPARRFTYLVGQTEQAVFGLHAKGAFQAAYVRYPIIYGPRQISPREWSVAKRIADGRRKMILPDGGLAVLARCAAENAAHCVLLTVGNPKASGQAYNCVDDTQLTLRQWAEKIVHIMGADLRFVFMPDQIAWPARCMYPLSRPSEHGMVSGEKARRDLGYRDVIDPDVALRNAVEWYVANPPTPEDYPSFADIFDYEAEDRLIEQYEQAMERIAAANPPRNPDPSHPYPHPRQPNLQRDHKGR